MNPALEILAKLSNRRASEIETAWRDAKHFRKTEGGEDYTLAWRHLQGLLKLPQRDQGQLLGSPITILKVGATLMEVESHGHRFLIPSCYLIIEGRPLP